MNQNGFNQLQLRLPGVGCWLGLLAVAWLLATLGLGWLVKSVLVIILLLLLAPVVAFLGLRLWLKRSLVEGDCPVCSQSLTGLKNFQTPCPNCGTVLKTTASGFQRAVPEGTIDVQAVDVNASATEPASPAPGEPIDVEVRQLPHSED
ncbi:hypothetical protein [Vasconcelosia minhoensis]|uniref:hypothetical protein n=1 Tax=Vasconcelosia minhoensis TaxID=3366354 RepID=UPI002AD2327E|nr:hypothetical protein [Romeria gracilis]